MHIYKCIDQAINILLINMNEYVIIIQLLCFKGHLCLQTWTLWCWLNDMTREKVSSFQIEPKFCLLLPDLDLYYVQQPSPGIWLWRVHPHSASCPTNIVWWKYYSNGWKGENYYNSICLYIRPKCFIKVSSSRSENLLTYVKSNSKNVLPLDIFGAPTKRFSTKHFLTDVSTQVHIFEWKVGGCTLILG